VSKKKLAGIIAGGVAAIIIIAALLSRPTPRYTLSLSVSPSEAGSISASWGEYDSSIEVTATANAPASPEFDSGVQVTVTANATSGYMFDHWSGGASGTTSTITITMDSDKSVTANFIATYTLTTSISPSGAGFISPSGGQYESGTQVILTASPASGYIFGYWSGAASGATSTITIVMNSDKSVTANFEPSLSSPDAEVILKDDTYFVHYEWDYGGNSWVYDSEIPRETYEYFSNRHRTSDYGEYVSNTLDDEWMTNLADQFSDEANDEGWDEFTTVDFVLSFVQSLPYTSDELTTGYDEYPRYPVETLVDKGGDCEDTSILFASIVRGMGYRVVLLELEEDHHMAVGVSISADMVTNWYRPYPLTYYTTGTGEIYAYCETTSEGWELGRQPEDLKSTSAKIIEVS
jgi:hypothetical protein